MTSREMADREDEFRNAVTRVIKVADPDNKHYGARLSGALIDLFAAKDACIAQAKSDASK